MTPNRIFSVEELSDWIMCPARYKLKRIDRAPGVTSWRQRVEIGVGTTLTAAVSDKAMTIEQAHSLVKDNVEKAFVGAQRRLHDLYGEPVDAALMAVSEWYRIHQNRSVLTPGAGIFSVLEHGEETISTSSSCDWFDDDRPRMYAFFLALVPSKTALGNQPFYGLRALASNCPQAWAVEGYTHNRGRQLARQVRVGAVRDHLRRWGLLAAKRIVMGDFDAYANPTVMWGCLDCEYRGTCGRFHRHAKKVSRG